MEEFACHDGTPAPSACWGMLSHLAHDYLEPLRSKFGATVVISGYRTPTYNRSVGGAPRSYHVYAPARQGVAADVRCMRGRPADWHAFLEKLNPGGLGSYPMHVHVDNRAGRARW